MSLPGVHILYLNKELETYLLVVERPAPTLKTGPVGRLIIGPKGWAQKKRTTGKLAWRHLLTRGEIQKK